MEIKDKIPTVDELIEEMRKSCLVDFMRASDKEFVKNKFIKLIKLHVKAALEAASENAVVKEKELVMYSLSKLIDEESILNAYPESNIK